MGKRDNQFVMILDIDRVFSAEDLAASVSPKAANRLLRRRCNQARGCNVGVHAVSEHEESISSQDFRRLCSLIYEESGIHLNSDKKTMLELRIKRRVRSLHLIRTSSTANICLGRKVRRMRLSIYSM